MARTAVFWIRDGVLIDRMHVNAVAFALTSMAHAEASALPLTTMTALVNFGFETSGISCADKMRRFNKEKFELVRDVAGAADYYNQLAGTAASHCSYFAGACELVEHLHLAGVLNFITSAVEQPVLDAWAQSPQAQLIMPHLTEVLGKRSEAFTKGRAHFAHARERYRVERMFYIADATAEIATGAQLSNEFNISPIGFAHLITSGKVMQAHSLVLDAHVGLTGSSSPDLTLDEASLSLPDEKTLTETLKDAGATHVVSGKASQIMANLSDYLQSRGVSVRTEVSSE